MCVCVRERVCAHNTHIHTHINISHPCVWVRTGLCIHAFINRQLHREKRFPQLIRELRGILHASAACCTSCSSDGPQPGVDPAEASVMTASASHSAVAQPCVWQPRTQVYVFAFIPGYFHLSAAPCHTCRTSCLRRRSLRDPCAAKECA